MIRRLIFEPVVVGNVVKAALTLLVTFGLALTDANIEAIVGSVTALMALWAVVSGIERATVTPMRKVTETATELGGTAVTLVERLTGGILDAATGKRLRARPGPGSDTSDSSGGP